MSDMPNDTAYTTGNVTEQWANYTKSHQTRGSSTYPWDSIRNALVSTSIIQIIGALVLNVAFIVVILSHKQLRCRPFYWHILGLCTSNIIEGVFCRPFATSYHNTSAWVHGEVFCKIWLVLEWTSFTLSILILVSLCIDRLEAKLSSLGTINVYRAKVLPVALCLFPWIFVFCVCLPMLIAGDKSHPQTVHCYFDYEDYFMVPVFSMLFVLPYLTLCIASVIMITVFIMKRDKWYCLSENSDDATQNLRSSTIATSTVSAIALLLSLPFVVNIIHILSCYGGKCAMPNVMMQIISYILMTTNSLITPLFWLVHTEVRQAYKDSLSYVSHRFGLCLHWRPSLDPSNLIQSQDNEDFDRM